MSKGELEESNLNRSPHSYLNNPAEERNKYVCTIFVHTVAHKV
jgi:hypothetical protein